MHEGKELASILRYCKIEHGDLAEAWNELYPRSGGQIPRTDLTIRWLTEEWTISEETHLKISTCLRHIMGGRMTRLRDYLDTGIVGSAERARMEALWKK